MDQKIYESIHRVDDTIDINELDLTPIQDFYKDAKILITGSTGFLGQILFEKLLRSCPVSKLYLMIRPKKGKDADTRLDEMLDDPLFNRMKKACPGFRQKLAVIEGGSDLPGLGLGVEEKRAILDEVTMIFHVAATVRFDENLKTASSINLKFTRDLCLLAQQMKQLKCFVQVSTAFANCVHDVIEEKVYPTAMSAKVLLDMVDKLDDNLLHTLTPILLGNYPNTYVFTKQIAEEVVKEELKGLPRSIFRPAMVVSTYKEPIRGWINNIYGPTGIFYGVGMGLLRAVNANKNSDANIVPVDMCVNGLIASAWDVGERFKQAKKENKEFEIPVYNYESTSDKKDGPAHTKSKIPGYGDPDSVESPAGSLDITPLDFFLWPITWRNYKEMSSQCAQIVPSIRAVWTYHLILITSYNTFLLLSFFLHLIPGALADVMMLLKGEKMRIIRAYKKLHSFSKKISYFSTQSFKFKFDNIHDMLSRMSKKDLQVFFCDFRDLDWEEFFLTYGPGVRVYLVKDPLETVPAALVYHRKLQWIDRILQTILGLLSMALLWKIVSVIYNTIFT